MKPFAWKHLITKKWSFLLPLAVVFALISLIKVFSLSPEISETKPLPKPVSVMPVQQLTVTPNVSGFAYVQPSRSWEAIAAVGGKITYRHPNLEKGALLPPHTKVMEIDPTDYQLALAQAEANFSVTEAQLNELTVKQQNNQASITIEAESLLLSEKELNRLEKLFENDAIGKSTLESQKITTLNQKQKLQSLRNSDNSLKAQQKLLTAQLEKAKSEVDLAEKNLARTKIISPYPCRVSDVQIEIEQFVTQGTRLFVADDISKAEVEVQVLPTNLEQLIKIDSNNQIEFNISPESFELLKNKYGLYGKVVLTRGQRTIEWHADFSRFSDRFDEKTRTIGIILEIQNPYQEVIPGIRPPLVKGMFVEVFLYAKSQPNQLVIPRTALRRNNQVYLVKDNTLNIQPVTVGIFQSGYVTITEGLKASDLVISAQVPYAIPGMAVLPIEDQEMIKNLVQLVDG